MHKQAYPHGHRIPMLMVDEPQDIEFLVKESEVLTGQAGRIFVIAGADWLTYRVALTATELGAPIPQLFTACLLRRRAGQ